MLWASFALLLALALLQACMGAMEFGTPDVPWVTRDRDCPTETTTWVHPDDSDVLETKFYCLKDPANTSRDRCYYMFVPACATASSPLVVNFHGRASCPEPDESFMRWGRLAKTECFITVYPWGNTDFDEVETSCWQQNGNLKLDLIERLKLGLPFQQKAPTCCCSKKQLGIAIPVLEFELKDDEFTRQVIEDAVNKVRESSSGSVTVDTKRIYLTGLSNGAVFALGFALENSDLVAGVALHSGWLNTKPSKKYRPIPIFMANGKLDPLFPYEPFDVTGLGLYRSLGKVKELEYLGNLNECNQAVTDSTTWGDEASLMTRTGCTKGAEVQLFTVFRSGHYPMLGVNPDDGVAVVPGVEECTIDTTKLAWDFLKPFSKDTEPDIIKDAKSQFFIFDPILLLLKSVGWLFGTIGDISTFFGSFFG